jgi:GT2 family glycosyltransferase
MAATLRALGPFDERIFLFGEDLDLCLRARAAGVQTWFWPAARVIHRGRHAADAAFGQEPFELLASARREAVARNLGGRGLWVDDRSQRLAFATRKLARVALGRSHVREQRQLDALRVARRGR